MLSCMLQDVPLSETGKREALEAAHQLSTYLYDIDACFTSTLDRAQATTRACLDRLSTQPKTMIEDYRLCERHYGESSLLF
jgi:2,3-bisphosphoglycerate-dependent phosphoglycerate mutase